MTPEDRLTELGLSLPAPVKLPDGVHLPFSLITVRGDRVLISGHPAQDRTGRLIGPYGQLGRDLTTEQGYEAARAVALSVMANLRARIGPLDRVAGWTRVLGMVNSVPGYTEQHLVMNGFSDLVLDVFGPEVGQHSRSAMGASGMPMNFAIEVEAEVLLR